MSRLASTLISLLGLAPALRPGSHLAAWLLIAANAIPLWGVLFARWDLPSLMALYWLEIAVIGGFNVLKIGRCRPREGHEDEDGRSVVAISLFLVIYYPAWLLYGVVLGEMIGIDVLGATERMDASLGWSLALLCLTHATAYLTGFLRSKAFRGRTPAQQLKEPLPRLVGTQFALTIGALLSRLFGTPFAALVVLTGLKTLLDLLVQEREDVFIEPLP